MSRRFKLIALVCLAAFTFSVVPADAQQFDPRLYSEMRWRCIGPFRAGRTVAISGVPQQPNVFYMAAVNGGVWKTTDFGNTWLPIFDEESSGSVGALAVTPSDPNILYVGSGEGLQRPDLAVGDGFYKSVTLEKPGRTSVCATPSRSLRLSSIPKIQTVFSSPCRRTLRPEPGARRFPLARRRQDIRESPL